MLARIGDFNRSMLPYVTRVAREVMRRQLNPEFQAFVRAFKLTRLHVTRPNIHRRIATGFGSIDPTAKGRAATASRAIFARYEGLIDAISKDRGLTPEQRASAILSLRARQSAEAAAASKAIMDDAKAAAKLRREMERGKH